jgi:hypothetical protein
VIQPLAVLAHLLIHLGVLLLQLGNSLVVPTIMLVVVAVVVSQILQLMEPLVA